MTDKNPNILSSQFFEPSIIEKFLQSTLQDDRYPRLAIYYLMQYEDDVSVKLYQLRNQEQKLSPFHLTDAQKIGLRDVIQALCTFLALPDDQSASQPKRIDFLKNRVLLGFCRLLNGQVTESGFEFDLVRQELYAKRNKRKRNKEVVQSDNAADEEELQSYLNALWGAQIAASLSGKQSEAERYAKWRQAEMSINQ